MILVPPHASKGSPATGGAERLFDAYERRLAELAQAIAAEDGEAVLVALDALDRLQAELHPLFADASEAGGDAAAVLWDRALLLQERHDAVDIRLGALHQQIAQQIQRLDSVSTRSDYYRSSPSSQGHQLDLRR